jgi:hypothetical protein
MQCSFEITLLERSGSFSCWAFHYLGRNTFIFFFEILVVCVIQATSTKFNAVIQHQGRFTVVVRSRALNSDSRRLGDDVADSHLTIAIRADIFDLGYRLILLGGNPHV